MVFGLKNALDNMKMSVDKFKLESSSQNAMIHIQVEEILKQTQLMTAWASSAERQAIAMEKLVKIVEEMQSPNKNKD